jgi:hypothetical protein
MIRGNTIPRRRLVAERSACTHHKSFVNHETTQEYNRNLSERVLTARTRTQTLQRVFELGSLAHCSASQKSTTLLNVSGVTDEEENRHVWQCKMMSGQIKAKRLRKASLSRFHFLQLRDPDSEHRRYFALRLVSSTDTAR